MSNELTKVDKLRRLPWLLGSSALNTIFCTLTVFGSAFILFLNELNLDKTQIGFLLSLVPYSGIVSLFLTGFVMRLGLKRTFLIFFGIRNFLMSLILFTPLLMRLGPNAAFAWIAVIMSLFALSRAIAMTAENPWSQEVIPNSIRGKFSAVSTIVSGLCGMLSVAIAAHVIGHFEGIGRFMWLIAAGTVAGFLSTACKVFVPGGLPSSDGSPIGERFIAIRQTFLDANYRYFLCGLAMVTLGTASLFPFIPLFMKERIGLPAGQVVFLDIGGLTGTLLSCYLWGWTSDRYGSKPIMMTGLSILALLPILWFVMPRNSSLSLPIAMGIAFLGGTAGAGWGIGSGRYLFVSAVPTEKKMAYMAVFSAWTGLVAGTAPLLGGRLLDAGRAIEGKFLTFTIDTYTPPFIIYVLLLVGGMFVLRRIRGDGALPMVRFLGMFFQGNPLTALGSLVRYRLARDETDRVSITERLGESKNPLSINELIEALSDPSFNVRYEAIISIARMPPEPRLVDELVLVLGGNQPELSVAAAWALGKLGEKSAIIPLRETLLSEYPLLRARSARALATLGDVESIPFLLTWLKHEDNDGVRLAYVSSLGLLRAREATDELLAFLKRTDDKTARGELALALACIVGQERYYIRLWQRTRSDIGTTIAQALFAIKKGIGQLDPANQELPAIVDATAQQFAKYDLRQATASLGTLVQRLPIERFERPMANILIACSDRMVHVQDAPIECVLLSLHVLHARCEPE